MTETEETIVYDAMRCITDNSKKLAELTRDHGSSEERKAYKEGIYVPAVKLQLALGAEAIKRGDQRRGETTRLSIEYFKKQQPELSGRAEPAGGQDEKINTLS